MLLRLRFLHPTRRVCSVYSSKWRICEVAGNTQSTAASARCASARWRFLSFSFSLFFSRRSVSVFTLSSSSLRASAKASCACSAAAEVASSRPRSSRRSRMALSASTSLPVNFRIARSASRIRTIQSPCGYGSTGRAQEARLTYQSPPIRPSPVLLRLATRVRPQHASRGRYSVRGPAPSTGAKGE